MEKEEKSIPDITNPGNKGLATCRGCTSVIYLPSGLSAKEIAQEAYLCEECIERADLRRRLSLFALSEGDMIRILNGRLRIRNLPEDTVILGIYNAPEHDGIMIKIQSKEFNRSEEGCQLPFIPIEYQLTEDLQKEYDVLEEQYQDLLNAPDDPMEA